MSYSLGQAKLIPGQIAFSTTPSGRLPSLQPLVEAGLPIAPYIEHGSYATGQPAIMRYGRDPYRGIMGVGQTPEERVDEVQSRVTEVTSETIAAALPPMLMISTGVITGAAGGLIGGLLGKAGLGTVLGAVGGGVLGWMSWRGIQPGPQAAPAPGATAGLSGMLAVV